MNNSDIIETVQDEDGVYTPVKIIKGQKKESVNREIENPKVRQFVEGVNVGLDLVERFKKVLK